MKDSPAHSGQSPHPDGGEEGARRAPDETLSLALAALERKERTCAELEAWLRKVGVDETEIAETIERLIEIGELDDARFARRYTEDKRELRGWGAKRIRSVLLERGVAPGDVEAALAEDDALAEVGRANALLRRLGASVATEADRAKALGHLTRRGYDYDVAYEAIRRHGRAA